MRKRCYLLPILFVCFLAACGPLSQPSSSSTKEATSPPSSTRTAVSSPATGTTLRAVDWADFTYFSSCYGNTQPFKARNGKAQNNQIRFEVYQPVSFGDLTGDGQLEAAVRYSCTDRKSVV